MALLCNKCGGIIADIYPLGQRHECGKRGRDFLPGERPVQCGMCGSTAIDHTEATCQINRMGRRANTLPKSELAPNNQQKKG